MRALAFEVFYDGFPTGPGGGSEGIAFGADGNLVVCEGNERGGGGRAIVRWSLEPLERTVIVDRYEGKRFNSPNDLTIDRQGRIYFSDPHYYEDPKREILELDVEAVYRVDADGSNLVRVLGVRDVTRPNGVELSPDQSVLYVTDTVIDGPTRLYAFPLDDAGMPTGLRKTVFDFGLGRGGDGMCSDAVGNLFVAAGGHTPPGLDHEMLAGIYAFSRTGEFVEHFPVYDYTVTNCTFGGEDGRVMYVTGSAFLWTIPTLHAGASHGPDAG